MSKKNIKVTDGLENESLEQDEILNEELGQEKIEINIDIDSEEGEEQGEEILEEQDNTEGEAAPKEKKGFFDNFMKKKPSEKDKLVEEKDALKQELGELKDKYVRIFAEFDNYKKRTAKEKIELTKTAGKDVILTLLPIIDDFERAFKASGDEDSAKEEGFGLIYQKLLNSLQQRGLKKMEAIGEVFDTEYHEALTEIPAPSDDQKGKIIDVIENGYYMNDKIIRYAKVVVGK